MSGKSNGIVRAHPLCGAASREASMKTRTRAKTGRGHPSPEMTYFEERGSVYDAPLDTVWEFIQDDEEFHPKAHRATLRNWRDRKLSDVTRLVRYQQVEDGRWRQFVARLTEIRPAVRILESLEGPFAGSTTVHFYRPRGNKTVVDVQYYMHSSELSPAEIKRRKLRRSANAYREDLPYFRRFVRKKAARNV